MDVTDMDGPCGCKGCTVRRIAEIAQLKAQRDEARAVANRMAGALAREVNDLASRKWAAQMTMNQGVVHDERYWPTP